MLGTWFEIRVVKSDEQTNKPGGKKMKSKMTLMTMALLFMVSGLWAEPVANMTTSKPQPVGGMSALEKNVSYPKLAVLEKLEGQVVLNFVVDHHGQVSDISVIKSGGIMFDDSAISAVLKTNWRPANQAGQPVNVSYALPFEFRIK